MATLKNPNKTTSASSKQPMGRVNKYWGTYIGIVKGNEDVQKNGRLQVWIPELGSLPDDENGWRTVSYCSPFAGSTPSKDLRTEYTNYNATQTSYGWWAIPPDKENQVAVMFLNGDPARGIWIGCFYEQFLNHMVPGIASSTDNFGKTSTSDSKSTVSKGKKVPVSEYNKNIPGKVKLESVTKPVLSPIVDSIGAQGLLNDNIRGLNTSTARREAPSQVYGLLTPGPKNKNSVGNRLGGHQLVFDDGLNSEYIGLKTRSGNYIRLDETNGLIYIINKKGTAWLQLDQEGNVDIFSAKSMSIRAMEDINFRADRDFNIEAGRSVNIKSSKDWSDSGITSPNGGQGGNVNIESLGNFNLISNGDIKEKCLGDYDLTVGKNQKITVKQNQDIMVTANGKITTGQNLDITSGMSMKQKAGVDFNIFSTQVFTQGTAGAFINGGASVIISGSAVSINGPPAPPAQQAQPASTAVEPVAIPVNTKKNILSTFSDIFTRNSNTIQSIVNRFITYEPCPEHKNKGNN